ncbi:hypothetical protein DCAR_0726806 [Daucus carota subsp. sativus]|uniref:Uncharacterized protein n=1 Tax=Daucus carota subsp. sativus TaxID=79200 RepID=A0A161ZJV4_DAUCS|nr:hypothetical protein DCAR_0726806 [Daucus carota subsp. sativus]
MYYMMMKIGFLILMVWLVLTSVTSDRVDSGTPDIMHVDAKLSRKVNSGVNNDQKTIKNGVAAGNFKDINDAEGYYPRDSSTGSHHRYYDPPIDGHY